MTDCCPTCGHKLPDIGMKVDPDTFTVICHGRAVKLQPQMVLIMGQLMARFPKHVRMGQLISAVWGVHEEPGQPERNISVRISHMRKAIRPLGLDIQRQHGGGWRLIVTDAPLKIAA